MEGNVASIFFPRLPWANAKSSSDQSSHSALGAPFLTMHLQLGPLPLPEKHLMEDFTVLPPLNSSFIRSKRTVS